MASTINTPGSESAASGDAGVPPVSRTGNVSGRALLIGALGVALTARLVTQAEMVLPSVHIGYLQFPPVALGLLLLATAINRGVKCIRDRFGLSGSDLLVIYSMMLVAAMVSSHGIVQKWIPLLVAPKEFGNANNNWHALYDRNIQPRLVPYDVHNPGHQDVVDWYFSKAPRGESIPWQPWIVPLLNWGLLIGLVLFAFLCLTAILRRQWVDNEKLSFPLAQLPLEIAGDEDTHTFFRSPLLWLGVALPVVIYAMKGLHQVHPTVPDVTLTWNLSDYVTVMPWQAGTANTYFILSFAAIGFFFLLPADVLFSIWFFFILTRVEMVVATAYNMDQPGMPLFPPPLFIGYQTIGAYLALSAYFVWLSRTHLKHVWASALGREKADASQEILPYRVAVWGLLGSVVASSLWLWGMGMSLWLAVFELVVFLFVIALVMARSTAEAGMLMTETTFRPIDLYRMVAPIHALGAQNLTMLAFVDNLLLRDQRGLVLTGMLDSARMSDGARIRRRSFAGAFMLGIGLALIIAVALNIAIPYQRGAVSMDNWMEQGSPGMTWGNYGPYFQAQAPAIVGASWQMPTFFSIGVGVTVLLSVLRASFFWWPLHPLGYAISGSWSTVQFWFPCLLAWLCKSITLRYGGMNGFKTARPFFLGMVLGEFSIAVFFVVLNILFKTPPPAFPWS